MANRWRIREEIITKDRANYGKRVVESLSDSLKSEHGNGFGRSNLFNMNASLRIIRTLKYSADTVCTALQETIS